MSELASRSCVPCQGGVSPLTGDRASVLLGKLDGWTLVCDHHITKEFRFPDFARAIAFTNRIASVAEEQCHHPDIHVGWGKVSIDLWTHKIDGLTESDFILAAKFDAVGKG